MKKQKAKRILQTILRMLHDSKLPGEELPENIPLSSIVFLAFDEDIEAFLPQDVPAEEFHSQALFISKEENYSYEKIYHLIVEHLSGKNKKYFDDDGDIISTLLKEILQTDMKSTSIIKDSGTHHDALFSITGYGAFFTTWDEIFHELIKKNH